MVIVTMRTQTPTMGMKAGNCRNTVDKLGRLSYWIIEYLTVFKIANNVQNVLQHVMPFWKIELVELNSNDQNFGNIEIKRGIFQVNSL